MIVDVVVRSLKYADQRTAPVCVNPAAVSSQRVHLNIDAEIIACQLYSRTRRSVKISEERKRVLGSLQSEL